MDRVVDKKNLRNIYLAEALRSSDIQTRRAIDITNKFHQTLVNNLNAVKKTDVDKIAYLKLLKTLGHMLEDTDRILWEEEQRVKNELKSSKVQPESPEMGREKGGEEEDE